MCRNKTFSPTNRRKKSLNRNSTELTKMMESAMTLKQLQKDIYCRIMRKEMREREKKNQMSHTMDI